MIRIDLSYLTNNRSIYELESPDSLQFSGQRHEVFNSLIQTVSVDLSLTKADKDWFYALYQTYGYDVSVDAELYYKIDGVYTLIAEGYIPLKITLNKKTISVDFVQSRQFETLNNLKSKKINVSNTTKLNGDAISALSTTDVYFKGLRIPLQNNYNPPESNVDGSLYQSYPPGSSDISVTVTPLYIPDFETDGFSAMTYDFDLARTDYIFFNNQTGTNIRIQGPIKIDVRLGYSGAMGVPANASHEVTVNLFRLNSSNVEQEVIEMGTATKPDSTFIDVLVDYELFMDLPSGHKLGIEIIYDVDFGVVTTSPGPEMYILTNDYLKAGDINRTHIMSIVYADFASTGELQMISAQSLAQRMLDMITGDDNITIAETEPNNIYYISGDRLNGTGTDFTLTFEDLFKHISGVFPSALIIDSGDFEIVDLADIYLSTPSITFTKVRDLELNVDDSEIYNSYTFCSSVDSEINSLNNFEYMTKREFVAPIMNGQQVFDKSYQFRGDGTEIEARRIRIQKEGSTDNSNKDIFFVYAKDVSGTITTEDESDYTTVTNAFDDNGYNFYLTPKRCLNRWINYIPSLFTKNGSKIILQNAEKNSTLITQKSGEASATDEDADITINDTNLLFTPEKLKFTTKYTVSEFFDELYANPHSLIVVDGDIDYRGDGIFRGWVESYEYNIYKNEITITMKLKR